MPRPKKTEAQLNQMRQQILDAAYEILLAKGPRGLTARAIAERLGLAHMALFTYFLNQAALLQALSEREVSKIRSQQQLLVQRAETEDVYRITNEALRFFTDYARANPNQFHLAWVMPELGGESIEHNRQRMQSTLSLLAELIQVGIDRGAFERRDPGLAAATVLGMVNMPHILFHTGKIADPKLRDQMVEEVLAAAMAYLKQPAA